MFDDVPEVKKLTSFGVTGVGRRDVVEKCHLVGTQGRWERSCGKERDGSTYIRPDDKRRYERERGMKRMDLSSVPAVFVFFSRTTTFIVSPAVLNATRVERDRSADSKDAAGAQNALNL